jgi:GNAT superfamily N-acetyltransferase
MNELNFNIRLLQEKDIEKTVEIIQKNLLKVNSKVYPPDVIDFMCKYYNLEDFSEKINDFTDLFIAESENGLGGKSNIKQIIGVGGWQINPEDPKEGIIRCMFVEPELHGIGIGLKLLEVIEKHVKSHITKLTLEASLNAVKFYTKLGYTAIETKDQGNFGVIKKMNKDLA